MKLRFSSKPARKPVMNKATADLLEEIEKDARKEARRGIADVEGFTKSKDAAAAVGRFLAQSAHATINCHYIRAIAKQTHSGEAVVGAIKAAARHKKNDQHVLDALSDMGMEDAKDVIRCSKLFKRISGRRFKIRVLARWFMDILYRTGSGKVAYKTLNTLMNCELQKIDRIREGMLLGFIATLHIMDDKNARNGFQIDFLRCAFPHQ
jgi:hypothetical protein